MTFGELSSRWRDQIDALRLTAISMEALLRALTQMSAIRNTLLEAAERGFLMEDEADQLFQQVTGVTLEEAGLA